MDASLVETHKQEALYSYKKDQPLTTYWSCAEFSGNRGLPLCGC